MSLAAPRPVHDPDFEELRFLRNLKKEVDDLLENSLRGRESLAETFARALPRACLLAGARGAVVTSLNEELREETWAHGDFSPVHPSKALADHPQGVFRFGAHTLVTQALDVAGTTVGRIGLLFEGDRQNPPLAARCLRTVETVAEELDAVLLQVQTASEKQGLILEVNEHLANPVFEVGMDRAVQRIAERVLLPGMMLLYRDAVDPQVTHYRVWREGQLEAASGRRSWRELDEALGAWGTELISRGDARLQDVVGASRLIETLLISGGGGVGGGGRPLGKLVVWSEGPGFSAFALDIIRVVASALAQRLMDYNRERSHLSQFFSARIIDELLRDPDYERRYLAPREEEVGILFADINGFTRISEQVLESPSRIGRFVDRWSDGVVDILWKHGAVFDKMVGDCVIGLFGPPFFRGSRLERAEATVRAAMEIQAFTRQITAEVPEVERIRQVLGTDGLGVAIGLNLAPAFCGLFGPNQDYTGFSTGMNQTARLQSLGGFRQTLVMASLKDAVAQSEAPELQALTYGPLAESEVKNVSQPLRYYELRGS